MSDRSGETASAADGATPEPPDISDIAGATTGPLRRPDASTPIEGDGDGSSGSDGSTEIVSEPASDATLQADWAAPSVDGLKEAVDELPTAGEPTELIEAIDLSAANPPAPAETTPESAAPAPPSAPPAPTGEIKPDPEPPPASTAPSAAPTVSIDANRAATEAAQETAAIEAARETAPSLAVTTAAAMPITSGEHVAVPTAPPDPTGDVGGNGGPTIKPGESSATERPGAGAPSGGGGGRSGRRAARFALLAVLGVIVAFLGAWLLDSARTSNQVMRNTNLGSTSIGGLDRDELGEVIDGLDAALANTPLTVSVDGTTIDTNPAALGAEVDREAVIDEALAAGTDGGILGRPFRWLASFTDERTIEPSYRVDPAGAGEGVAGPIGAALDDPVEPALELAGSELTLRPGSDGVTVDPAQIGEVLPAALAGPEPLAISLTPVATSPRLTDDAVDAVVDEASTVTANPVVFQVLDQTAQVEPGDMRAWIELDASGDEPTWSIDSAAAIESLRPKFPVLGTDEQQARFEVVDGVPEIFPATETVICCDEASVAGIRDALLEPAPPPDDADESDSEGDGDDEEEPTIRTVSLEPEVVSPDEGVAELESLGIVEEVSTFTTNFPCCQSRVTNIQRFADLMRGVIIRPGEDFSLNGHVGRRTIENGFVADQAIANGILEPQVGGGISQFATTFFNAAFFAGIDFNEYQSHSLYISRYPQGREATISFPKPDLSVNNSTEYGILVWTSYTDTSITVTFYSTQHIDVVAGDLLRSSQGACSRYTTPRTRTYPDGTVVEDSVFAVYRPGEGLDCNGNSTRPEEEPAGPTAPTETETTSTEPESPETAAEPAAGADGDD